MRGGGGAAEPITDIFMDARQPSWSPDSTRIAFQAYRSSTWQIWTIKADGTDMRAVTSGPYDDREPAWSPDGQRIAFSSDRPSTSLGAGPSTAHGAGPSTALGAGPSTALGARSYDVWVLRLATGE